MGDVIKFPGPSSRRKEPAGQDQYEYMRDPSVHTDEQQDLIDFLLNNVMEDLYESGYDVVSAEYDLDVTLVYESLKSFILKLDGYAYPLQILARELHSHYVQDEEYEKQQLSFNFDE